MDDYRIFAIDFVKRAGDIMRQYFTVGVKKQMKADATPVTEADTKINRLLIEEVARRFPDHAVLGEEESHFIEGSRYVWVCDPIDGTRPFTHGIPIATSSLALVKDGESVLGAIYDPFCDRLYCAEKGKGATMNGQPIHVSQKIEWDGVEGAMEASARTKYNLLDVYKVLRAQKKVRVSIFQSVAYTSMLVAAGEFDFNIFPSTGAHDVAAIKIIVEEAGGKVTDLFGQDQRYDREVRGLIVTNGKIHSQLQKIIGEMLK